MTTFNVTYSRGGRQKAQTVLLVEFPSCK